MCPSLSVLVPIILRLGSGSENLGAGPGSELKQAIITLRKPWNVEI